MHATLALHPAPPWRNGPAVQRRVPTCCAHSWRPSANADAAFIALLGAYRPSGGLARVDEVTTRLGSGGCRDAAALADWIVELRVISFDWHAQTWLPWFQFRTADHYPAPALLAVVTELSAVYDGWELATWFAQPNSALAGGTPVDRISGDPDAVLQAARADRYIATG